MGQDCQDGVGARVQESPTKLLKAVSDGDASAGSRLLPLVYRELRVIAQKRMAMERPGHTLQATALVHEAFMRLCGGQAVAWNDRAHFFHAAAEAMRRLLVEHARKRGRLKRGGDRRRVFGDVLDLAAEEDPGQIMILDSSLQRLEERDARAAEVVRLRFFAGLSIEQTAEALGLSAPTVKRSWEFARAFLFRALEEEEEKDA